MNWDPSKHHSRGVITRRRHSARQWAVWEWGLIIGGNNASLIVVSFGKFTLGTMRKIFHLLLQQTAWHHLGRVSSSTRCLAKNSRASDEVIVELLLCSVVHPRVLGRACMSQTGTRRLLQQAYNLLRSLLYGRDHLHPYLDN